VIAVDLFCGGGGASEGIRAALGCEVRFALNHSEAAIQMHEANHPHTHHIQGDVWAVPSWELLPGRRRPKVDLLWASPDCRHFSRARGGKPRLKGIRDLPWVILQWVRDVRPRVIGMENVPEILSWGPLGEDGQPDPARAGETWDRFVAELRLAGYAVDWRVLTACDYGAPTSRRRLFLVARCDGRPVRWPEPTHGPGRPQPHRTAAECIDWSDLGHSIFLSPEEARAVGVRRPLAEATQRRIAAGVQRYVLESASPFVVRIGHQSSDSGKVRGVDEPLSTITSKNEHLLCTPLVTKAHSHGWDRNGGPVRSPGAPLWTVLSKDASALVAPVLIQSGYGEAPGQIPRCLDIQAPLGTIVAGGSKHALVAAFLSKHYTGATGQPIAEPLGTITAQDHHSLGVAFLAKYYGTGIGQEAGAPLDTITSKARFGLVAALMERHAGRQASGPVVVSIGGQVYAIADITMRMLQPRELAAAQGFPDTYILTGTKAEQVARIGNSVPPQVVEAVVRAQFAAEAVAA
jgi:DNA (cytosine-5)-methyltransferase 1